MELKYQPPLWFVGAVSFREVYHSIATRGDPIGVKHCRKTLEVGIPIIHSGRFPIASS